MLQRAAPDTPNSSAKQPWLLVQAFPREACNANGIAEALHAARKKDPHGMRQWDALRSRRATMHGTLNESPLTVPWNDRQRGNSEGVGSVKGWGLAGGVAVQHGRLPATASVSLHGLNQAVSDMIGDDAGAFAVAAMDDGDAPLTCDLLTTYPLLAATMLGPLVGAAVAMPGPTADAPSEWRLGERSWGVLRTRLPADAAGFLGCDGLYRLQLRDVANVPVAECGVMRSHASAPLEQPRFYVGDDGLMRCETHNIQKEVFARTAGGDGDVAARTARTVAWGDAPWHGRELVLCGAKGEPNSKMELLRKVCRSLSAEKSATHFDRTSVTDLETTAKVLLLARRGLELPAAVAETCAKRKLRVVFSGGAEGGEGSDGGDGGDGGGGSGGGEGGEGGGDCEGSGIGGGVDGGEGGCAADGGGGGVGGGGGAGRGDGDGGDACEGGGKGGGSGAACTAGAAAAVCGDEKAASNKVHLDKHDDQSANADVHTVATPGVGGGGLIVDLAQAEVAPLAAATASCGGRLVVVQAPRRKPIPRLLSAATLSAA